MEFDPNKDQPLKPNQIFVPQGTTGHDKKLRKWNTGLVLQQGERAVTDWRMKRVMYERSTFYLYLKEYEVALIREGDLYGELIDD